jgi:hypothetical protein
LTTQRVIYPNTASEGLTVFSSGINNDATNEIEKITNEIIGVM